ncbi:hypothetical protein HQ585_16400 [candidate division KSB1 bacterium]|nr:hypothetical protein [candidate division KSB1 bacterium]
MKRALLIVCTAAEFVELGRVAAVLKQSAKYEPIVLFAENYPNINNDIASCHAKNIVSLYPNGNQICPSKLDVQLGFIAGPNRGWKQRVEQLFVYLPEKPGRLLQSLWDFIFEIYCLLNYFRYYKRTMREVNRIIEKHYPDIFIIAQDNVGYFGKVYGSPVLIKTAHKKGIPVVVVPFALAIPTATAEEYLNDPSYSLTKWINRLVGFKYPRWVYEYKGCKLLPLHAYKILVMEWLGVAPPNPWMVNSGFADAIVVESKFAYQYYLQGGIPKDKLVLTGALSDDVLTDNFLNSDIRRKNLYQELGVADLPMILCALPPNQHVLNCSGTCLNRPEVDFKNYDEIVQFWVRTLAAIKGYHTIVVLHPRLKYNDMKYLEKFGVKIVQKETAELISLCDIYVSSMSSTIRWAITCGKPVINYDVFKYRYKEYLNAPGVLTMENKNEFANVVQRLANDRSFYAEIVNHQAAYKEHWGRLDGRAGARILTLIDQLIDQSIKEEIRI